MSRGDPTSAIPNLVLKGIDRAFKTYLKWTFGDSWLSEAPEHFVTSEVAQHLFANLKHPYLNLEYSVKDALKDAGSKRRGRPRKTQRSRGRFDILLSRASGDPWCAIELKSPIWFATQLLSDIRRLRDVVGHRIHDATISCGALGFYADKGRPQRKHATAKASLESLRNSVTDLVRDELRGSGLTWRVLASRFRSGDDGDGRQAFCVFIKARKPRKQ